jgi:hypothetical protein
MALIKTQMAEMIKSKLAKPEKPNLALDDETIQAIIDRIYS